MEREKRFHVIFVLVAGFFSPALSTAQDEAKFRDYLEKVCQASFQSEIIDKSPGSTLVLRQNWKLDVFDHRVWCLTQQFAQPGGPITASHELLATPSTFYQVWIEPQSNIVKSVATYVDVPTDFWDASSGLNLLSLPFGLLKDGRKYVSIVDLSTQASASQNGQLRLANKEYEVSIFLNPAKGWMPERIVFDRIQISEDPDRPVKIRYEVLESQSADGVWFPKVYTYEENRAAGKREVPKTYGRIDGVDVIDVKAETLRAEVTIESIRIRPIDAEEFYIQSAISNGTDVSMMDAHHLDYVWKDGKTVPRLSPLKRWGFIGGEGPSRATIVAATAILILIIVIMIRWRSKRISALSH